MFRRELTHSLRTEPMTFGKLGPDSTAQQATHSNPHAPELNSVKDFHTGHGDTPVAQFDDDRGRGPPSTFRIRIVACSICRGTVCSSCGRPVPPHPILRLPGS